MPPTLDTGKWFGKQDEALEEMERVGNSVLVKWDSFHFASFVDQDEFMDFVMECAEPDRQFFEILSAERPQLMFADLDGEGLAITRDALYVEWDGLMRKVFGACGLKFDSTCVRLLNSTGDKISGHWSYLGLSFKSCVEQKAFWLYVDWVIEREHPNLCFMRKRVDDKLELMNVLDIGVYSRNRAMRTIYSHKAGSERVLRPIKMKKNKIVEIKNCDPLEYLIYRPEAIEFYDIEVPKYDVLKHKLYTQDDIQKMILGFVPNVEISEVCGRVFKLRNVGVRVCLINGEENVSDKSYVVWKRDGLYFGCHDAGCGGQLKKLCVLEERAGGDGPEMRLLESPHTDEDYAEYFMERYPDRYRVLGDVLYEFEDNAHTWRRMEDEVLFDYLGGRMFQRLRECLNRVFRGIRDAEVHAKMTKSLLKLRSWANRKGVVCSIKAKCAVHEDPFDLKPHLFGFKNGVYDLDKMEFRAGTTADMVSQRANYDYRAEEPDGKRAEMMRIIDQIMPVAEERDYLLTAMASGLYGKTVQNLFILTGEGGNGKDMLMSKLYRECVGHDHYNYSNPSILTERRKSDLNQGIANMHKKRVVLWSELPKNGVMIGAVIKELTGGDLINARGLYSKDTNTVIQMSGFMLVNGIPRSDVMDGGLARRLIVIIFRSLFKDAEEMMTMANVKHVYKKDGALDTNEFRDKFKLTLFHILLDYFAPFKANGHMMPRAPKSIRDASQKYMEDSDELMTWFNEFYEKTEEPNACVQIKDMYTQYKQSDLYSNMNKSEKRATNAKSMIELVEKHPTLRVSYVERLRYGTATKQKNIRNAIVGYRVRPVEEDSDSDEDE
jgi:phage/plasmid-associated DNA primase